MTIEALLAVFILVILFVAVLEFGIAGTVRHAIVHAATVAAREAGKGADINELETVVEYVLFPHKIAVGPSATVILEDPDAMLPVQKVGGLDCDPPVAPPLISGDVRVTVCVRLNITPFANCLAPLGVDLSNRCIRASSVVQKE